MPRGGTLSSLGSHFDPLAESARRAEQQIAGLENQMGSITSQVADNSRQISDVVTALKTTMQGMRTDSQSLAASINTLSASLATHRDRTREDAATIDDVWAAYKKMGVEVNDLQLSTKALTFTQKEMNKITQMGTQYNNERATSYNSLSALYRAMKILYDNMTDSERKANTAFVGQLRGIYENMNLVQQATGKYQLQVGDYSKAMTGLNIATQQVVRELPVLANGAATFAIAISNNIPILVDQIVNIKNSNRALEEHKRKLLQAAEAQRKLHHTKKAAALEEEAASLKVTSATRGLVKSIFSWQTALVLVLTVLPAVIRKIQEKKKAAQELNGVLSKQMDLEKELSQASLKAEQSGISSSEKLKVLYAISQDTNRSMQDRLDAVKALQQTYPDYFGNLSMEAILQGQATTAYDKATEALIRRAKAQAYLDKITEAEKQKEEYRTTYERERAELVEKIDKAEQEQEYARGLVGTPTGASTFQRLSSNVGGLKNELKELDEKAEKFYKDTDTYVNDLTKRIQASGFFEDSKGAGSGSKEGKDKSPKVFDFDWTLSGRKAKDYSKHLEVEYEDTDAEIIKIIKTGLDNEKALRDNAIYQEYADRKAAGENIATLKNDINARLLESDRQYYQEYLRQLSEAGVLTTQQYEDISAKLYSLDKGGTDTSKRKGKGKKYGGIVEAMMAYSSDYGDVDTNGYKIVKDEYSKYAQAIDSALSSSISYMGEWMDARVQMAEIAVECAEKEMNAAKTTLDYEMQARANGYANSVETAQKEYENKRKIAQKAAEEAQELQRIQELTDTAQQVSSLVTATANIWSAESIKGLAGVPLAATATGLMWAAFAAAKIKAAQLSKAQTETYGEGMSEYLDYGGSHSSGHDIDFGTTKNGTRRRVERGEMIGVINKRNVRKYGVNKVSDIINSLNRGEFENKYGNAFVGAEMINGSGADLSRLERGVNSLVEQGNTKVVNVNGKTITMYKNTKRIIKS